MLSMHILVLLRLTLVCVYIPIELCEALLILLGLLLRMGLAIGVH